MASESPAVTLSRSEAILAVLRDFLFQVPLERQGLRNAAGQFARSASVCRTVSRA